MLINDCIADTDSIFKICATYDKPKYQIAYTMHSKYWLFYLLQLIMLVLWIYQFLEWKRRSHWLCDSTSGCVKTACNPSLSILWFIALSRMTTTMMERSPTKNSTHPWYKWLQFDDDILNTFLWSKCSNFESCHLIKYHSSGTEWQQSTLLQVLSSFGTGNGQHLNLHWLSPLMHICLT